MSGNIAPMTLEQAQQHIGSGVVYTAPHGSKREDGVITSVGSQFVFVRYGADRVSKATHPQNLQLLAAR